MQRLKRAEEKKRSKKHWHKLPHLVFVALAFKLVGV